MASLCRRELEAGLFGIARRKTPGDSFGESGRRGPTNPWGRRLLAPVGLLPETLIADAGKMSIGETATIRASGSIAHMCRNRYRVTTCVTVSGRWAYRRFWKDISLSSVAKTICSARRKTWMLTVVRSLTC